MADNLPVRHRTQTGNVRPPFPHFVPLPLSPSKFLIRALGPFPIRAYP